MRAKTLNESPDYVVRYNSEYDYSQIVAQSLQINSFAFGYDKYGYIHLSRDGESHGDIVVRDNIEDGNPGNARQYLQYAGRIWMDQKIISFWFYPKNNKALKQIINDIEMKFKEYYDEDIDIWNDPKFTIEVNEGGSDDLSIDTGEWTRWREEDIKLIPLKDYKSSKDASREEIEREHIKSPLLKKNDPSKAGKYHSKKQKPLAWRQAMYAESYYPKLNENPNASIDPKIWQKYKDKKNYTPQKIEYNEEGNIPFSYFHGKLVTGTPNQTHLQLMKKAGRLGIITKPENERQANSGRIFSNYKFISFWVYPKSYEELIKVIKELEKVTKLNILNDSEWLIEIPSGEFKNAFYDENLISWGSWHPRVGQIEFIPIKDYKGGYARSESELGQQHIETPMKKKQRNVPDGFGSKKQKPLAWRQAMYAESYYPRLKS